MTSTFTVQDATLHRPGDAISINGHTFIIRSTTPTTIRLFAPTFFGRLAGRIFHFFIKLRAKLWLWTRIVESYDSTDPEDSAYLRKLL